MIVFKQKKMDNSEIYNILKIIGIGDLKKYENYNTNELFNLLNSFTFSKI